MILPEKRDAHRKAADRAVRLMKPARKRVDTLERELRGIQGHDELVRMGRVTA